MYKIGDIVKVKITNILNYGAFCEFDKSSGLIHVSEFSDFFVSDIKNFVQIGDVVDVEIIEYDQNRKQAKLSFKKIRIEHSKKTDSLIQETPSGFKNLHANLDEWIKNGFSKKINF